MVTIDVVWLSFAICISSWVTRESPDKFKYIIPIIYSLSFVDSPQVPVNMFMILSIVAALGISTYNPSG